MKRLLLLNPSIKANVPHTFVRMAILVAARLLP